MNTLLQLPFAPVKTDIQSAVRLTNVSKSFGSGENTVRALRNVSLETEPGQLQLIVGPSGCGKTTLLCVMAGTLKTDAGTVEVFGENLTNFKDRQLAGFRRKNVGFIFQQFNLMPTLTLAENVSVPLLINGIDDAEAEERAAEMLKAVGLGGREFDHPRNLSGGQQQRVAIARALVHKPRLVICDEPTSALDKETGARVMDLLKDISRQRDRSVLVVTHDTRVYRYADRIISMEDGEIHHDETITQTNQETYAA